MPRGEANFQKALVRVGSEFIKIKILKYLGPKRTRNVVYLFKCHCGKEFEKEFSLLKKMKMPSCGCLNKKTMQSINVKHGGRRRNVVSKVYSTWISMKERCYNKKNKRYMQYGGRGVCVQESWINNFDLFRSYIGEPPSPLHSIDRIDTNGNYCEGNVRWLSQQEQCQNKRNNVFTPETVRLARLKFSTGHSLRSISEELSINIKTVDKAVKGRSWKNI